MMRTDDVKKTGCHDDEVHGDSQDQEDKDNDGDAGGGLADDIQPSNSFNESRKS